MYFLLFWRAKFKETVVNALMEGLKKARGHHSLCPCFHLSSLVLFVKCLTSIHTTVLHCIYSYWTCYSPFFVQWDQYLVVLSILFYIVRAWVALCGVVYYKYANNLLVSQVLIMDKVTVKVMSHSCKMADITDQGVSRKCQNRF